MTRQVTAEREGTIFEAGRSKNPRPSSIFGAGRSKNPPSSIFENEERSRAGGAERSRKATVRFAQKKQRVWCSCGQKMEDGEGFSCFRLRRSKMGVFFVLRSRKIEQFPLFSKSSLLSSMKWHLHRLSSDLWTMFGAKNRICAGVLRSSRSKIEN